jgi:branched-chain amino acid transport system substrate-binding protein
LRPAAPQPIWIGHVAPFSGPDKAVGEHARQGILLAVEEATKDEQTVADRPVQVLHADTYMEAEPPLPPAGRPTALSLPAPSPRDATAVQAAAVRLVTVNRAVALLGGRDAAQVKVLGQVGVPVITPAGPSSQPASDKVFYLGLGRAVQGKTLARFAAQAPIQAKRVALLLDERDGGNWIMAEAFVKAFAKPDTTQLSQWAYKSEAQFAELAGRAKAVGADAFLIAGTASDVALLLEELRKMGVEAPVLFAGPEGDLTKLQADPERSRGLYGATSYGVEAGTPRAREFAQKYQERFQERPDLHAALAYDGLRIVREALRRARSTDSAKVREALAGLEDFDSLTGPVAFGADYGARRPVFIGRLENRDIRIVQRYEPEK